METKSSRVLCSISYWSIFFAPFILPILIWIFSDRPASSQGKKAFFNHLGTFIFYFVRMASYYFSNEVFSKPFSHQKLISNISLSVAVIFLFIALAFAIYNLVKGFQFILQHK
ncbi:hypothetical protein [Staphylococcus chromogenes]|uniref:hypothetical protein n=1 Tax=Staphylococcus chromogenes TaxID=46126 RepID=UPI000D1A27A6|nr:hypothetical protein [Staphylococcus chromogenes]MDT0692788.1 hypothetical protein [Staphylococcus chromogenes]MDT0699208.1 hypothetical protein [Staphylococcus chromogenes]PTF70690.1 hypothetical protein BUY03_06275 [Staphylococcus chromogenes]PTF72511.1 hypothetical protein BUY01_03415 [Staphylococcus chromogenes]PTG07851.1 hypothetical protein BU648_05305 [Staphylococcus chromogenes]